MLEMMELACQATGWRCGYFWNEISVFEKLHFPSSCRVGTLSKEALSLAFLWRQTVCIIPVSMETEDLGAIESCSRACDQVMSQL